MFNRFCFGALLLACLAVPFTGCDNASTGLDSISISPNTSLQLVVGNTTTIQLTVTGTYGNGAHPTVGPVSNVTWTSSIPTEAMVSSTGLVSAGVTSGTPTITATAQGYNGPVTASVQVSVINGTGGGGGGTTTYPVDSLTIIPSSQSVAVPGDTSQFICIGTDSAGNTEDLTGLVAWTSSSAQIASIGTAATTGTVPGLATAVSKGVVTITAEYTNATSNTVATGTALFTVVNGGGVQAVTALTLIPNAETLSASGQSGQLIALATMGNTGLIEDATNSTQIAWSSNIPSIATVSTTGNQTSTCNTATPPVCVLDPPGLVKGASSGDATITAEWTNPANGTTPANVVNATAAITVTNTPPPEPLLSLSIIPSSLTVDNLQGTGQFLAIGTFSSAPYVRDLTDSVTWISSFPNVFPVNSNTGGNTGASAGIVTAYGSGGTTLIAEAISNGSIQTATATFSCPLVLPCPCLTCDPVIPATACVNGPVPGSCYPGSQASALLSTVTIYNEGVNTTNWLVTAPSATGTQNVIHCGPGWTGAGGSVCVATYPIGTPITITATQPTGTGTFGGWSSTCTIAPATINPNPSTAAGPNTCTLTPTFYDETVGVIFN
jgi:hypothetical protein